MTPISTKATCSREPRPVRQPRTTSNAFAAAIGIAALSVCGSLGLAQDPGFAGTPEDGYPGQTAAGSQNPDAPASPVASQSSDPPARVLRISILNGDVSAEPASVNTFSPAELNQVLTSGDRVYTDPSATTELQGGQMAVRLGGGADLTVTAMTDTLAQFGLAAGSAHLRSFAIDPGTVLELDTPEAAITVLQPGDIRVDEDPSTHSTTVDLLTGQVQVDSPGYSQVLAPGQRLRIHGADTGTGQAGYTENLAPGNSDTLDSFSVARDNQYSSGSDAVSPYVNADTVGSADLAAYGSWDSSDYGPVWYPAVAVGWAPYCYGHWRWIPPWGWTWVGNEPWGFAPFHYGRWAMFQGRWGWVPGPHGIHAMYAPALVAFAGGPQFSASLGYAPGLGITAWFPLGPREPYAPWYHGSTLYLNRVNASNIYDPNLAEARAFYNQRAVNVFTSGALADRPYLNRASGTIAVQENSFAAGRPVDNIRLHIPRETLASAPVLPHPMVSPERSMVSPGTARAMPSVTARPVLTEHAEGSGRLRSPDPAEQQETGGAVLVHRAEPPAAERSSFDQQRRAMQNSDPGRPLSPVQMQNLRENRPAGPPANRESIPHPAAAPHSAPPPARSAPPAPPAAASHR